MNDAVTLVVNIVKCHVEFLNREGEGEIETISTPILWFTSVEKS